MGVVTNPMTYSTVGPVPGPVDEESLPLMSSSFTNPQGKGDRSAAPPTDRHQDRPDIIKAAVKACGQARQALSILHPRSSGTSGEESGLKVPATFYGPRNQESQISRLNITSLVNHS